MIDHDRLSRIFLEASALTAGERAAFLDAACRGDGELRAELEGMLAQTGRDDGTERMAARVLGVASSIGAATGPAPGPERIGRYRIVSRIGEGSMGVVYLARQENPNREVALKVIARGVPTSELRKRFEIETRALGRLQHPGIAQIIEAGMVETGPGTQPFFAMEHVSGLPLVAYAERHGLGLRDRIGLVVRVCEAVQHAHQRGVIHRDLKPGNIVVDARGQPKILDFGVARVTEPEVNATTAHTAHGVLIGTLGYMSPEQVRGDAADVDTRADVYSLGAVCYELLAGRLPHDLEDASLPEAIRRVAGEHPRRLSAGERRFPSDLETIVAKALEPDRERRYGSASELAGDLRRFLAHEPITARSPSALYHLRKLVTRNRLPASLIGALALSLATLGVILAVHAGRIRAERDRAEREASVTAQVSKFLTDVFRIPDPGTGRGKSVTAREVLARGVERIRSDLGETPDVRARLLLTMADADSGLGLRDEADELYREALAAEEQIPGRDPEVRVLALTELGWLSRSRGAYDEGLVLGREAEEVALASFGPEHPMAARCFLVSGVLLRDKGDFEGAGEQIDKAVAIFERAAEGGASEDMGRALLHRGWLEHVRKDDEEALETYERTCPVIERTVGSDHPMLASCLNDLSVVQSSLGRAGDATTSLTRALAVLERILPADHPDLASSVDNLGTLHWKAGDFAVAAELYRRGLEMRRRSLGPDHIDVGQSLHNLGLANRNLGRSDEAVACFRDALAIYRKTLGPDHARVHNTLGALGMLYRQRGEYASSVEVFRERAESLERIRGPDDPQLAGALQNQAVGLMLLGRPRDANPLLVRALGIRERAFGMEDPRLADVLVSLGECREAQNRHDDAAGLFARAESILDAQVEIAQSPQAFALQRCSRFARARGDIARADALLARALAAWERFEDQEVMLLYARAVVAAQRGDRESALPLLRQALAGRFSSDLVDLEVELAPLRDDPELVALLREFRVPARRRP